MRVPILGAALALALLDAAPPARATGARNGGSGQARAAACPTCPTEPAWCDEARTSSPQCTEYLDRNSCSTARGDGYSCCADTALDAWSFNEREFCVGCAYTFYALVECGTEMHIPLFDMEGARIRIHEVLSGNAIPITCRNQEASDPDFHLVNCDRAPAGPGPEDTYLDAPVLDANNLADPTQYVSWGFDDAVPCQQTDTDVADCRRWSAGSGLISMSPGEQETVDCVIQSPSGLCGVYQVEIVSGGNGWFLYANCDGSATPHYRIYDACADACAVYTPRPELTVANLANTGTCPIARVEFDAANIGCTAADPVRYRITSDCQPPDRLDGMVAGGIGPNTSVHVVESFPLSCTPATITVTIDPDDALLECSESTSAARCNAIPGDASVEARTCVCLATLGPDAGSDAVACQSGSGSGSGSGSIVLDAVASTATGCAPATVEYRWIDDQGTVVCPWSAATTCSLPGPPPLALGTRAYTLEQRCSSEPVCVARDVVSVTVYADPLADAGPDRTFCAGDSVVLGGLPSAICGSGPLCLYAWAPATDLDCTTCANPVATPSADVVYTLTVTDPITRCTADASARLALRDGAPGTPPDLGNVIRAVRAGAPPRDDETFTWSIADPRVVSCNVRVAPLKTFTGSSVVAAALAATTWTDPGVIRNATPLLFFRISGTACNGLEGPY